MNRRTFPNGQATASKLKALVLHLERVEGAAAADAWLAELKVERGDLDEETRLLPLTTLKGALSAFERRLGRAAIGESAPMLVAQDNLGVWMKLLRGTQSPEDLFARLDGTESEYGRTTRWETVARGPGSWRGRVRIAHDPALEEDGLLAAQRAAELSVVPMLFGFDRGRVEAIAGDRPEVQEFSVAWGLPPSGARTAALAALGAALGAIGFAWDVRAGAALAVILGAAGAGVGYAGARDRERKVVARAQDVRVRALERSLQIKESREDSAAGDLGGTVVAGQYRIGKRMGSSASGVIYEAVRIGDGTSVAIKLLRAAAAHDTVASDRLRRESEALGLAWHPNVVEVLDHGHIADGTSYLVMELLRGESLAQRIRSRGRLSAAELQPIALQVLDAMVAVHAAGVVHRDIKPSNLFLVPDPEAPQGERAKVLDFGIARVEWEEMRITNTGAPLGTPGYMSPEQESGGDIDARSDLFAVGACFYECLMGEPPPPRGQEMWRAPEVAPPSSQKGDSGVQRALSVPAPLRAVVERALEPDPEARWQDARSFLAAMRSAGEASASESGAV